MVEDPREHLGRNTNAHLVKHQYRKWDLSFFLSFFDTTPGDDQDARHIKEVVQLCHGATSCGLWTFQGTCLLPPEKPIFECRELLFGSRDNFWGRVGGARGSPYGGVNASSISALEPSTETGALSGR